MKSVAPHQGTYILDHRFFQVSASGGRADHRMTKRPDHAGRPIRERQDIPDLGEGPWGPLGGESPG